MNNKYKKSIGWKLISRLGNLLLPVLALLSWSIILLQKFTKKVYILKHNQKKNILLITQNGIAADHIKLIRDLFKNDPKLNFVITDDSILNSHFSKEELASIINESQINIIYALLLYWDLIIFVNHPWALGVWFAPFIKKIYINHGIWTGKINNDIGEDGVYGKSRVIRPYTRPLYNKMFAASFFEKKLAIKLNNQLKSRIVVTGFLRADLIQKLQKEKRYEIRSKLNLLNTDIVVHIVSTWGPSSLFQTIGDEILIEASKITNKYKFLFSLHPRHDEFGDIEGRKRQDILENIKTKNIMPASGLAWHEHVVASDVVISDHSSLCLYYALLNKPVILAPVKNNAYIKGSVFDLLKEISLEIKHPEDLDNTLQEALKNKNKILLQKFSSTIRNYSGQADKRYREEIFRILEGHK